ncbi:hypothetical protein [Salinispora arenicola]|uniref:hypothetical protein n=1 Tax=Salinispora arenicola TaxID=168697 RepID=UPI001691E822|nr:hypothetical protein [Salinispora arenicola]NIL64921.1 hypothetical protein [Salinispora arenicola]
MVAKVVAAGEFDVVTDLAAELPLLVLADLLGVPKQDRALLYGWSNHLVGFDDPDFGGGDIDAVAPRWPRRSSMPSTSASSDGRVPRTTW